MEKDSTRRYRTAQEFAEELGRCLNGEPILARPVSRVERLWRWCRRKPALAALGATVLLLLTFIAIGSTVAALRLKQKEQDLRTALRGAYLSEAHLRRESGKVGQRFHSLTDLARAAAIRPSLELRNEAIAALALPDLREIERFECAPGAVLSFDATLTTCAEWRATGGIVQLWEWEGTNARPTRVLRGHQSPVVQARFIPQTDLLWTASYEPSTRLWPASTGKQLLATPHRLAMDVVAGRRVALQVAPTTYAIHELVTGDEYQLMPGPLISPTHPGMSFSLQAPLSASASLDGVRLWHLPSGLAVGVWPVGPSRCALFHPPDGSLLVAADERVTRWPVEFSPGGETIFVGPPVAVSRPKPRDSDFRFALSADGSTLACAADTQAEVLDLRQNIQLVRLTHGTPLSQVALSPDAAWAVTSGGERFKVWGLPEGQLVADLPGGGSAMAAFSPDARWVVRSSRTAGSSDGLHRLHRVGSWELMREFLMQNVVVGAAGFSPDGRLLALRASSSGLRLLDTRDWSELATFDLPDQQMIFELAFSPDSTRLGVTCGSRLVQVWDLRAVRQSLARLGLDWNQAPYPSATAESQIVPRFVVKQQAKLRTPHEPPRSAPVPGRSNVRS